MIPMTRVPAMTAVSSVSGVATVVVMTAVVLMTVVAVVVVMTAVSMVTVMTVAMMLRPVVVHRVLTTMVVVVATVCVVHAGLISPVRFESCLQCRGQVQSVGSISDSTTHLWLVMLIPSAS